MDVLKCHQDMLMASDSAGTLRAYVTKYVSKFSDAAQDEWLNGEADAVPQAPFGHVRREAREPVRDVHALALLEVVCEPSSHPSQ